MVELQGGRTVEARKKKRISQRRNISRKKKGGELKRKE